jgi:hypothetical protein
MQRTHEPRSTARHYLAGLLAVFGVALSSAALADTAGSLAPPGASGKPYPNMPPIAPIGERIDQYYDVPQFS